MGKRPAKYQDYHTRIERLVETINSRQGANKCALLIGAGCSVSAGIPLAATFVQEIIKTYPSRFEGVANPTYPLCMSELADGERRDLIGRYIKDARLNWAHIGMAMLMATGVVDRILTTNFDPLIIKACSMINEFPAVYDCTTSLRFKPEYVHDKAIFHLHGQHSGFVLLNTPEECEQLSSQLSPLFADAGMDRTWIVVGYSGENDPVFEQLARVDSFTKNLFWVGYQDDEPARHVRDRLLNCGKFAFYINEYNADTFFVELCRQLKLFPPRIISRCFTTLHERLNEMPEFPQNVGVANLDVLDLVKKAVEGCANQYESKWDMEMCYISGRFSEIEPLARQGALTPLRKDLLARSYAHLGNNHSRSLTNCGDAELKRHYDQAVEHFQKALDINDRMYWVHAWWALAMGRYAKRLPRPQCIDLYEGAIAQYEKSIAIKPTYNAHLQLAIINAQAATHNPAAATGYLQKAYANIDLAGQLNAEDYELYMVHGYTLLVDVEVLHDNQNPGLLGEAITHLERADALNPGCCAYNLACAYCLLNDLDSTRKWLEVSRDMCKLPRRIQVEKDTDLKNAWGEKWFKALVSAL